MAGHSARLTALLLPLALAHGQEPATVRLTRPLAEFPEHVRPAQQRDGAARWPAARHRLCRPHGAARGFRSRHAHYAGPEGRRTQRIHDARPPAFLRGVTTLVADVGQSRFLRATPTGARPARSPSRLPPPCRVSSDGADRQGRSTTWEAAYGEDAGRRRAAGEVHRGRLRRRVRLGAAPPLGPDEGPHRHAGPPAPRTARQARFRRKLGPSDHHVAPAAVRSRGRLGGAAGRPRRDSARRRLSRGLDRTRRQADDEPGESHSAASR